MNRIELYEPIMQWYLAQLIVIEDYETLQWLSDNFRGGLIR